MVTRSPLAVSLIIGLRPRSDGINAFNAHKIGRKANVNVRTGGLRRRFFEKAQILRHQLPCLRFSNRVERRPRKMMSNL